MESFINTNDLTPHPADVATIRTSGAGVPRSWTILILLVSATLVICLTVVIFLPQNSNSTPADDQVLYLPGLAIQPTFKHYAGFLNASETKKFFYWFVESERDPSTDPVVLWLNGGPGCSSLNGLLSEHGPWRTKYDGSGLDWFEQRWNKIANIIYMESPQCVGFSYEVNDNCSSSDSQTAVDNHLALVHFFQKYPQFKRNDFYVTGESYGGVYVPMLASRIMDDEEFNFKGFAVGNPVTDFKDMTSGFIQFAWGHGLLSRDLWNGLVQHCCVNGDSSNCSYFKSPDSGCSNRLGQVYELQWRSGINPYNFLADCHGGAPQPEVADRKMWRKPKRFVGELCEKMYWFLRLACSYTDDKEIYLNRADVRHALHVPTHVSNWIPCSNEVESDIFFENGSESRRTQYKRERDDVRPEYDKILNKGHRVLNYYGDQDMACPHLGGLSFVESLNRKIVKPYSTWRYKDGDKCEQIAGFVLQYENLKFVTVKGAGHFVPSDKPDLAFTIFRKFLHDEPY